MSNTKAERTEIEDMPLRIAIAIGKAQAAMREALWDCGFDYTEFADFKAKLEEMRVVPHVEIAQIALRYLGRLDINRRDHAAAIKLFGQASALAGQLAAMHQRRQGDEADVDVVFDADAVDPKQIN